MANETDMNRETHIPLEGGFDVINDPWIPVDCENGTHINLGIRAIIETAKNIKCISDANPMVEYSIYRFLSVFLMDALRPKDYDAIKEIRNKGCFDMNVIDSYIRSCREEGVSFDLFDPSRPFLQSTGNKKWDDRKKKTVAVLDYSIPSGDNHIHFNHLTYDQGKSYAEVTRLLITTQVFCMNRGSGLSNGVNGEPPYYLVINGNNLFETLLFLLVPRDSKDTDKDFYNPPVFWRNDEDIIEKKKIRMDSETSWIQSMFFPSRTIKLIRDSESQKIYSTYYCAGMNYGDARKSWRDPHVLYNTKKPIIPSIEEPIWKSVSDFVSTIENCEILKQYLDVYIAQSTRPDISVKVTLYGVYTTTGLYKLPMRHEFDIPTNVLGGERAQYVNLLINEDIKSEEKKLEKEFKDKQSKGYVLPQSAWKDMMTRFLDRCDELVFEQIRKISDEKNTNKLAAYRIEWKNKIKDIAREEKIKQINSLYFSARELTKVSRACGELSSKEYVDWKEAGKKFLNRIDVLDDVEQAVLKNSAGIMWMKANNQAKNVFQKIFLTDEVQWWYKDYFFAVACIYCLHIKNNISKKRAEKLQQIPDLLGETKKKGKLTNSIEKRIYILIDTPWASDGYMLEKLYWLIKWLEHNNIAEGRIDYNSLLSDLCNWNSDQQTVQSKWLIKIFGK